MKKAGNNQAFIKMLLHLYWSLYLWLNWCQSQRRVAPRCARTDRPYVNTVENSAFGFSCGRSGGGIGIRSVCPWGGGRVLAGRACRKYYRLSNGAYAAASYEEAVHYLKEDGTLAGNR